MTRKLSGRSREAELLLRALRSGKSEFVAVYGRRRVGKTFLVRRFFQDQDVVYFEAVGRFETPVARQLESFADAISATFHRGRRRLVPPRDWGEAFRVLRDEIEAVGRPRRRFVIFLDELPWLATHRSGFLSALEHFWNAWCQRREDIVLVVCGSAASWMLRRVVHARGGLHNRLTQTIRLLPFTLGEARAYFADRKVPLTNQQLVELYLSVGGVPHYLDHVDRGRSVPQIIDDLYLREGAPLGEEFDRLFASLFGADPRYVAAVRALAVRRGGLARGDLLARIGIPSGGTASTMLANLVEGGFVESTIPFGRTSRDRFLRLTDELSLFHLKWLAGRSPSTWQTVRGTPSWQAWAGLAFESLCLRHVEPIKRALGISGVRVDASAWLHRDAQIDLLLDRADGVISVCEVKFSDTPFTVTSQYAARLRNKLAVFRAETGTRKGLHLVMVTSYGVRPNAHSRELIDAEVTMEQLIT